MRKAILTNKALGRCLVDDGDLRNLFRNHTGWYDTLRGAPGGEKIRKGIRNLLEHGPGRLMVGCQQTEDEPPTFSAAFYAAHYRDGGRDEMLTPDLLPMLRAVVSGFACFFQGICKLVDPTEQYERGDWFFSGSIGCDDDVTAYWPELSASATVLTT